MKVCGCVALGSGLLRNSAVVACEALFFHTLDMHRRPKCLLTTAMLMCDRVWAGTTPVVRVRRCSRPR